MKKSKYRFHIKALPNRFLQAITWVEHYISVVCLVITSLLIFAQVVNRYWLHFEIMVLGDLALYCFIFFMFVAAALTTREEGHVSVAFFREKILKGRPKSAAVYRFFIIVITIITLAFFFPSVYQFLLRALQYPEYGSMVRWFNTSWLMTAFFIMLILILLHLLVIAYRDFMNIIIDCRSKRKE